MGGNVSMIVPEIGKVGIVRTFRVHQLNVLKSVTMVFELETKCVTMDWMTTWDVCLTAQVPSEVGLAQEAIMRQPLSAKRSATMGSLWALRLVMMGTLLMEIAVHLNVQSSLTVLVFSREQRLFVLY